MVLFLVLAVAFALLLHFTAFGRGVFDIGLNDEAAHFTGVNVERTKFLLFVLTGVVSALAGIYYVLEFGSARGDNATGLELQVIAAVLLGGVSIFGGRGRLHGVVAGVLLIGVIASALRLRGRDRQRPATSSSGCFSSPRCCPQASWPGSPDSGPGRTHRGSGPQSAPVGVGTQGR